MRQPFPAGVFAFVHGKLIMQTEPEVLTDHTELICSTNIERIVTGRDAALKQIGALIENLNDISELTSRIGRVDNTYCPTSSRHAPPAIMGCIL